MNFYNNIDTRSGAQAFVDGASQPLRAEATVGGAVASATEVVLVVGTFYAEVKPTSGNVFACILPTGAVKVHTRPSAGGGSDFPADTGFANPLEYGYSVGFENAYYGQFGFRRGRSYMSFVTAHDPAMALMFEGINTTGAVFKIDNVVIHRLN